MAPEVAVPAAADPDAAAGRRSLADALRAALAELLALLRASALCSLNPSLLCCDDVDSLEIG